MGIRETLNKNPGLTTGATVAVILAALGWIVYSLIPSHPKVPTQDYFTVDDGQTWFTDDNKKVPPFDHDGKQAVKAYVFSCNGGKSFVAYLEKYTPETKKMLEEATQKLSTMSQQAQQASRPPDDIMRLSMQMEQARMMGKLVKKPGEGQWMTQMSPKAMQMLQIKCPDSSYPEPVYPR